MQFTDNQMETYKDVKIILMISFPKMKKKRYKKIILVGDFNINVLDFETN